MVLELCEQLATRYFAPHNKKSDAQEPSFDGSKVIIPEVKEALTAFAKADLISMSGTSTSAGAQLPATVARAGFAWFSAANVSTTGYLMLTMANANLLAKFGSPNRSSAFVNRCWRAVLRDDVPVRTAGRVVAGRYRHAPNRDDGTYRLFGSKMWISGATTSSPTTSCTWYWPRSPADRRAPRASRCSSCPSSSSTRAETSGSAMTWCWPA